LYLYVNYIRGLHQVQSVYSSTSPVLKIDHTYTSSTHTRRLASKVCIQSVLNRQVLCVEVYYHPPNQVLKLHSSAFVRAFHASPLDLVFSAALVYLAASCLPESASRMYASRGLEIAGVFTNGALLLPCPWAFVEDASLLRSKYLSHFLFLVSSNVSALGIRTCHMRV
jgi:hypothetical protein